MYDGVFGNSLFEPLKWQRRMSAKWQEYETITCALAMYWRRSLPSSPPLLSVSLLLLLVLFSVLMACRCSYGEYIEIEYLHKHPFTILIPPPSHSHSKHPFSFSVSHTYTGINIAYIGNSFASLIRNWSNIVPKGNHQNSLFLFELFCSYYATNSLLVAPSPPSNVQSFFRFASKFLILLFTLIMVFKIS